MPAGDRIFVTGATGLLGTQLCRALAADGHSVVALSRSGAPGRSPAGVSWLTGDITRPGDWYQGIDGAQAIVHLAGEPIADGRWTAARKEALVRSRIESTLRIAEAIENAKYRPSLMICASATGYYGPRGDEVLDERAEPGEDFLARLCIDWESAAQAAAVQGVRVINLRFGVILSRSGGALARMLPIFKLGVGGPLGPPERYFPWIHEADATGLIRFALEDTNGALRGPVNATAPEAVRMGDFARCLGRVLRRPAFIPVPIAALRLVLGEAAGGLVPGQHVVPEKAVASGYTFRFPQLERALRDLV